MPYRVPSLVANNPVDDTDSAGIALTLTNSSYIKHQELHRTQYSHSAKWFQWQNTRTGKDRLFIQNDRAYRRHVGKVPGLHELHRAEELHRFHELPVYYQDEEGRVRIDPSIPPMGDPYHFHGAKWKERKFKEMWQFWVQCYPSHACDIEKELHQSRQEGRKAWWNIKNRGRIVIREATSKRSRPDDTMGNGEEGTIEVTPQPEYERGHFERTYLGTPCQICGSPEHPALMEKPDEYNEIKYGYLCPISLENSWETWYMRPCPIKMAAICNHDEYQVLKLWHRIINDGWGQHQNPRILRLFLNMANKACREFNKEIHIERCLP